MGPVNTMAVMRAILEGGDLYLRHRVYAHGQRLILMHEHYGSVAVAFLPAGDDVAEQGDPPIELYAALLREVGVLMQWVPPSAPVAAPRGRRLSPPVRRAKLRR